MPCSDTQSYETNREIRRQLDIVTDMLCWTLKNIEPASLEKFLRPDILAWWKDHQEIDKKREVLIMPNRGDR